MTNSFALSLALAVAAVSVAHAEEAPPPPPKVSDATLGVAKDHHVTLTLAGDRVLTGVPASWDAENIIVIEDGTRRIVTVARIDVQSIQMADAPVAPQLAPQLAPPMASLSSKRHVGLQVGSGPGNVFLDVDYGHFYGFVGTSIGYPIIFSGSDQAQFFAFAVGAGGTWRISPHSNWKFDLMGTLTPTWWGGFSAGIGIAAGFHYTSPTGFTFGFKIPLIGAAPGCNKTVGDSTYDDNGNTVGCQKVSGGANLVANYYLQAGMSLPLLSLGYRF